MLIAYLESTFKKNHTVIGSSSAPNEALSRSFINLVIFNCVLEGRMLINKSKKKAQPQTSSSFAPPVTPPKMTPESPAPTPRKDICVYFETEIRQAITFQGKDYMLSGIADYSFGLQQCRHWFRKPRRGGSKETLLFTFSIRTVTSVHGFVIFSRVDRCKAKMQGQA